MSSLPDGTNVGDLLYWDGSAWTKLAPGTQGFLLQTKGIGFAPVWVETEGGGLLPEGDFTTWGFQWTTVLPDGIYDEWYVDWLVDEVNEKVIFNWYSSKGSRILVLDLATGAQLSLTADDYCESMVCNIEKGGITWGGGVQMDTNAFSRSNCTYFLVLRYDNVTHEVWRNGSMLFSFNPDDDMVNSLANPVSGISPTGEWIIAVNGSGSAGVGDIVCYKGSA